MRCFERMCAMVVISHMSVRTAFCTHTHRRTHTCRSFLRICGPCIGWMSVSLVLKDMHLWQHIGPKKVLTSCDRSISAKLMRPLQFLCSCMKTGFPASRMNPTPFGAGAHCHNIRVPTPGASLWDCLALVFCHPLEQQSVMCWPGTWPTWQKVCDRATTTVVSCCRAIVLCKLAWIYVVAILLTSPIGKATWKPGSLLTT